MQGEWCCKAVLSWTVAKPRMCHCLINHSGVLSMYPNYRTECLNVAQLEHQSPSVIPRLHHSRPRCWHQALSGTCPGSHNPTWLSGKRNCLFWVRMRSTSMFSKYQTTPPLWTPHFPSYPILTSCRVMGQAGSGFLIPVTQRYMGLEGDQASSFWSVIWSVRKPHAVPLARDETAGKISHHITTDE